MTFWIWRAGVRHITELLIAWLFLPHIVRCMSLDLQPRAATYPAPIVVSPSGQWDGNDGPWSSFALQIGTPPQTCKVLISTASTQTWAVTPEGCVSGDSTDCQKQRGEFFNYNISSSYVPNLSNLSSSIYGLDLESSLGYSGKGRFGFDDITLGWQGSGGPTIKNQTIAGIATKTFFMGLFGLTPRPTNFTNFNNPIPSFMQNIRNQSMIPSMSWAYTAGNQYRLNSVAGSLTLGGYDTSKFVPNNLSFPIGGLEFLDVQIASITTDKGVSLLPSPIKAPLDSTVPFIYLPISACSLFESTFGLTWNDTSQLYLVNDTQHTALQAMNPSITFKVGPTNSSDTVDITLPYSAFDLTASRPLVSNASGYFPLRRAANATQYLLGRTFFQEAYVTVDYDRGNFSVSQCKWDSTLSQNIVPILPPGNSTSNSTANSSTISTGAIAGIASGGAVVAIVGIALLYLYYLKPRFKKKAAAELAANPINRQESVIIKPELDGSTVEPQNKKHDGYEAVAQKVIPAAEMGGTGMQPIYELPAREEVAAEMTGLSKAGELEGKSGVGRGRFGRRKRPSGRNSASISPDSAMSPESPVLGRRDRMSSVPGSPETEPVSSISGTSGGFSPGSTPSVMVTPATPIAGRGLHRFRSA